MLCCTIVCLYIVVGLTFSRSAVLNTREAAFFRVPEPAGFVRQKPGTRALDAFRRHLGDLIQPAASSLETAHALRAWSYRQQDHTWTAMNGGDGEDSVDPEVLLAQQQRGVPGACRRFAYVYLGALLSAGLNARVVSWDSGLHDRDSQAHTLVEVWIKELHTWKRGRPLALPPVARRGGPDPPSWGAPGSLTPAPECDRGEHRRTGATGSRATPVLLPTTLGPARNDHLIS